MHRLSVLCALLLAICASACSPFYSVEQSDVERGYRWISRGEYDRAVSTFKHTLGSYPDSVLAHIGIADAYAKSQRGLEAVEMYTKALALVSTARLAGVAASGPQTIGDRFFSYQNQGLTFPYGVEAYVYQRRGSVYESLLKNDPNRATEYRAAAVSDFNAALKLAPAWIDPKERIACLTDSPTSWCSK